MSNAIWQFETAQYKIVFRAEPEQDDPAGHFDSGDDNQDRETIERIRNGYYDWFVAIVEVIKNGKVIGADYLGGCCYENARDFCEGENRNFYFRDMVRAAIEDARNTLAE